MKTELWRRLCAYEFEDLVAPSLQDRVAEVFGGRNASTKAFAAKLAKKLDWNVDFALRAIGEYKKFLYLGIVDKYVVTPPKVIDEVWHQHIQFTAGYRSFCANVLHQHFDHSPELVPFQDQTGVFNAQYVKLLDYYRYEFNTEPPADIWGTPKFNTREVRREYRPQRKENFAQTPAAAQNETPLWTLFDGGSSDVDPCPAPPSSGCSSPAESFSGGGGESGGGGASGHSCSSGGGGCSSGGSSCGGGGGGD